MRGSTKVMTTYPLGAMNSLAICQLCQSVLWYRGYSSLEQSNGLSNIPINKRKITKKMEKQLNTILYLLSMWFPEVLESGLLALCGPNRVVDESTCECICRNGLTEDSCDTGWKLDHNTCKEVFSYYCYAGSVMGCQKCWHSFKNSNVSLIY